MIMPKISFANRQFLMKVLLGSIIVFLLFYWTHLAIGSKILAVEEDKKMQIEKLHKVESMALQLNSSTYLGRLDVGLLSYVQSLDTGSLAGKILNIKLVSGIKYQEQVSFRGDNLTYDNFVYLINSFENFSNLKIRNLTVTRRFDNPKRVDVLFDIIKGR